MSVDVGTERGKSLNEEYTQCQSNNTVKPLTDLLVDAFGINVEDDEISQAG